jgi:hypothetical protein
VSPEKVKKLSMLLGEGKKKTKIEQPARLEPVKKRAKNELGEVKCLTDDDNFSVRDGDCCFWQRWPLPDCKADAGSDVYISHIVKHCEHAAK